MGKRALEAAGQKANVELELRWLPFMLDPSLPAAGVDKLAHYRAKFGPGADHMLRNPDSPMKLRGRAVGCDFVFVEGSLVFNSLDAHRLLHYALVRHGAHVQNALQEVLFRKYFKEGVNLGLHEHLVAAAQEVECLAAPAASGAVAAFLSSGEFRGEVAAQVRSNQAAADGVPLFVFPSGRTVSGGQEVATFVRLLEAERRQQ